MVYVIKISNQSFYKIGITKHKTVKQRLSTLQSACPYILEIYTTSVCGDIMEVRLHQALRGYYLRGEWFELPISIANRLKCVMLHLERLKSFSQEELDNYLLVDAKQLHVELSGIIF